MSSIFHAILLQNGNKNEDYCQSTKKCILDVYNRFYEDEFSNTDGFYDYKEHSKLFDFIFEEIENQNNKIEIFNIVAWGSKDSGKKSLFGYHNIEKMTGGFDGIILKYLNNLKAYNSGNKNLEYVVESVNFYEVKKNQDENEVEEHEIYKIIVCLAFNLK
jgi:hypothetical protein